MASFLSKSLSVESTGGEMKISRSDSYKVKIFLSDHHIRAV